MKFNKIFLSFVVIISLSMFAGCSDIPDCSTKDTTYVKYSYDENLEQCTISKEITKNKCGNGIIEDGENYCTCSEDVNKDDPEFGCDGTKGEFLEKSCKETTNECVLTQNQKVVETTKSIQFKNSDLIFDAQIKYNTPFILNIDNKNQIIADISLFKFPSSNKRITNIKVEELRIEDNSNNLLSQTIYNSQLVNVGDKLGSKSIELSDTTQYDSSQTMKFKLVVSYIVEALDSKGAVYKTEEKKETLINSISKFRIINPNFYEE